MSMNAGDIVFYINGDDAQLRGVLRNIDRSFSQTGRNIGLAMGAAGAAITGMLGLSANVAIEWESAFAGVRKTVDATEEQFAALEKGIIDLSMEIPVAATELAKLAEIGGQMGVPKEAILEFTKQIAILGETTNLTGEEGAALFAQFANVAQVPVGEFSNLAAAIVATGNAGNSTEREIAEMGLRIAGAGALAKFTAGDIAGIANSLVSVGLEAQAGGSSITRVIVDMFDAVQQGGDEVEKFAKVAGVSAEQFIAAWKENPALALTSVIQGLKRVSDAGGNVFQTIREMGFTYQLVQDTLSRATLAADGMAASIELGNKAYKENNAHLAEAEKRFSTTESQITIFKNSVTALAKEIGDALLPGLTAKVQLFTELTKGILDFARAMPETVAQLVSFASVTGVALTVAGFLVAAIGGLSIAFPEVGIPVAGLVAAITALVAIFAAAVYVLNEWGTEWIEIPENLSFVNTAITQAGEFLSGVWSWIVEIFSGAVSVVGSLLDRFAAWAQANWGQIVTIFSNAVDGILLIGGMLWEGLKLTFSLLWEFLSRVFGEIGEGWREIAGVAGDESKTWLDVIQIMQEKTLNFLGEVSKGFERFTDFIYYIWPLIGAAFEIGANLVVEPLMNMLDAFYWVMDQVTWIMKKLGGAWDWLAGASGFAGGVSISGPPGMATGGVVQRGGWAMVGERGPEMVKLPRGATVYDARQTAAAGGGGGITINMVNNFNGVTDVGTISRELGQRVRLELSGRGI